jgi:hypothetical protein
MRTTSWAPRRDANAATRRAVWALLAGVTILVAGACGGAAATPSPSPSPSDSPTPTPSATPTSTPSATPTLEALGPTPLPLGWSYSDIDGVAAPDAQAHALPLAIMVDDNKVARPQSGMSTASVVFQAMADGGEDRYMVIWQENPATDIGPIRSARPYFVYWAAEYKALFGHYGGDPVVLEQTIPQLARYIYNEDALNGGSCPYHRISTRVSPHNAYTNTTNLINCANKRGYPSTIQKVSAHTFVDDSPILTLPSSQTITIPYRTGTIGYQFDRVTDSYVRSVDGQPQIDPANNKQVIAHNVVVMFQTYAMQPSIDHLRPVVGNVGTGSAIFYKEGQAIQATWKKTSTAAPTRFYDKSGKEIPFVRGEIFIQSVPIGTKVTNQ